jgi:uncharacterized LabA/DUF88 family protein
LGSKAAQKAALAFSPPTMRTNFYIDAFNLYYGCLKNTAHKWLNLEDFCRRSFPPPRNQLNRIRYFTALVKARPHDPQQPIRQQTYLRAIQTLPMVSIHYGTYLESQVRMRLVTPPAGGPATALVYKSEEKGSDVNIATYLLLDAFENDYEVAVVVSNDSDLAEPISLVRKRLNKKVLVLMPCSGGRRQSVELKKVATKAVTVDPAILATSQFPPQLPDAHGMIHKPASW